MSPEKPTTDDTAGGAGGLSGPKRSLLPLLVTLVNSVAVLGVLGLLVYTRIVYKRPVITEQAERVRLAALHASPAPAAIPGLINFEPVTVNIRSTPAHPRPADGTPQQLQGKLHFVTVGFAVEVRDISRKDVIETLRPIIMDRLLSILGRKDFSELTTVQGRYLLRSELLDVINQIMSKDQGSRTIGATNVYFTQFVAQ